MKKSSTIFLQTIITIFGLAVLAALLIEPNFEGVNANRSLFEIYFQDPFLAYVYLASIPFFIALYKGFKMLGYIRQNKIFGTTGVKALQTIKRCAFLTAILILGALIYIRVSIAGNDDSAGALMLGMIAMGISVAVGVAAIVFEKILKNAAEIQSQNDLLV